jgi:[acyl-carrier-protein] S-malonyltransferase
MTLVLSDVSKSNGGRLYVSGRDIPRPPHAPAMPVAFLFPGQSSVSRDALMRARQAHPAAGDVAARAADVLGPDDTAAYLGGDTARLASNRDVQVVVFLASQMYLHALAAEGVTAAASLGLSLGEYSHLVHIGALTFEDALALVSARGRCYDEAPAGVMVTVLGADRDTVTRVVAEAAGRGCAVVSNFNTPTQHVLAGEAGAVTWAASILEEEHGAYTTVIEERVPMHSPLMTPVAEAFAAHLRAAPWQTPRATYLPNVSAAPLPAATPADFVAALTAHVSAPVLWDRSLDHTASAHPGATFVEVGPGGVLHNMLGRSWKPLRRARLDAPDAHEPATHFMATVEALRAGL